MQNPPCKQQRDVGWGGWCERFSVGGILLQDQIQVVCKVQRLCGSLWSDGSTSQTPDEHLLLKQEDWTSCSALTQSSTVINKRQLPGVAEMATLSPRRRCFILLCLAAIQISQAAVQVRVIYYSVLFLVAGILWQKSSLFPVIILRLVSKFSCFNVLIIHKSHSNTLCRRFNSIIPSSSRLFNLSTASFCHRLYDHST